jgi:4-amino-4-deoxy-L-arabinose transferase-like glycosyltransferase
MLATATLLAGFAIAVRVAFFTGFFGSDEVVYVTSALKILQGEWPVSGYIGAIRQGVNAPIALSMAIFGVNEPAAALWAFLASVAEVVLVYVVGRDLVGRAGALFAALFLALLPLHAHLAGRLMADAPLALFITLTFLLFWKAERSTDRGVFFLCGVAAGAVFWIKESVIIFLAVLAAYPFVFRTWNPRWVWIAAGAALMVGANCLFFWAMAGHPLHVFVVIKTATDRFIETGDWATSPWYYLRYLFLDVRHTWLLGPLALAAVLRFAHRRAMLEPAERRGVGFALFWAGGLLLFFSLFFVSVAPLKFISKQTNYMTIFMAPLCLLAGWWVGSLRAPARAVVLAAFALGAVPLLALERLAIENFAANSKATVEYARRHPDAMVYGPKNAYMAGQYYDAIFVRRDLGPPRLVELLDEAPGFARAGTVRRGGRSEAVGVVDLQTIGWGRDAIRRLSDVPSCWQRIGQLDPRLSPGAGATADALRALLDLGGRLAGIAPPAAIRGLVEIKPAFLYTTWEC